MLNWSEYILERSGGKTAEANHQKYYHAKPILWPPHATSWLIGKDSDAERENADLDLVDLKALSSVHFSRSVVSDSL